MLLNCTINVGIKVKGMNVGFSLLDWTCGSFKSDNLSLLTGGERRWRWKHRFQCIKQIMCSERKLTLRLQKTDWLISIYTVTGLWHVDTVVLAVLEKSKRFYYNLKNAETYPSPEELPL